MSKANESVQDRVLDERVTRLQDLEAINQALIQQCRSLDEHDLESFLGQFDAAFTYSYNGRAVSSREMLGQATREGWLAAPKTTHLLGNVVVDIVQGGAAIGDRQAVATSDCLTLTFSPSGEMKLLTEACRDRLVKRGGDWRFAARVIESGGPFALVTAAQKAASA